MADDLTKGDRKSDKQAAVHNFKKYGARLILLLIGLVALASFTIVAMKVTGKTSIWGYDLSWMPFSANADSQPSVKQITKSASKIAAAKEAQEGLPKSSLLAKIGFGEDQNTNQGEIEEMTHQLSQDIGKSDAIPLVAQLRQLRQTEDALIYTSKYSNETYQKIAARELKENREKQAEIEAQLYGKFQEDGAALTLDQVRSLGASPNSEDLTSMISAFATLKEANAEMEQTLWENPSQENAQLYYSAHIVLLQALSKLQTQTMERIEQIHIVQAQEIEVQAKKTIKDAQALLQDTSELSENEVTALKWNIQSCKKTIELSQRTQAKLNANFAIITKANKKLAGSIATAENCYMTAKLQKEILSLENSGGEEIAKIEALTVPQLAAVNFADPENLEVKR